MYAWISALRKLAPRQQVQTLGWAGLILVALAMILVTSWDSLLPAVDGPGVVVKAVVASKAVDLEADVSLVAFSVRFTAPGDAQAQLRGVHTFRYNFEAAELQPGTPVALVLNEVEGQWLIYRVQTLTGHVLFDSWMNAQSVNLHNFVTFKYIVLLVLFALACFIASALIWYRQVYQRAPDA